jgi:ribosomal protein S18 acetylase RimI-like enzyme
VEKRGPRPPVLRAMFHIPSHYLTRLQWERVNRINFSITSIATDPKVTGNHTQPSMRTATANDKPFLYSLYRQTMHEVIEKTWGWDEAWQRSDFETRFGKQAVSIIEVGARSVGSLWLERRPGVLYVSLVNVAPQFQGRGIGTAVMQDVIAQAAAHGNTVELSVLEANRRARPLYERLGFRVTAIESPFVRMRHVADNDGF